MRGVFLPGSRRQSQDFDDAGITDTVLDTKGIAH